MCIADIISSAPAASIKSLHGAPRSTARLLPSLSPSADRGRLVLTVGTDAAEDDRQTDVEVGEVKLSPDFPRALVNDVGDAVVVFRTRRDTGKSPVQDLVPSIVGLQVKVVRSNRVRSSHLRRR
jgi:hypothetical protein